MGEGHQRSREAMAVEDEHSQGHGSVKVEKVSQPLLFDTYHVTERINPNTH